MTTLTIRFDGRFGELSGESFALVINESLRVLRDLDVEVVGQHLRESNLSGQQPRRSIKWVVRSQGGLMPTLTLESRVLTQRSARGAPPDFSSEIRQAFTHGVTVLERGGNTPPHYSTANVRSIERIVKGFNVNGMTAVTFSGNDDVSTEVPNPDDAKLTPGAGPKIARLTGSAYHAYGAVEGYVQLVSLRGRRYFNITQSRTLKSVRCNFLTDIKDDIFEALRSQRKVIVAGRITYNVQHEPINISVANLRFLRADDELPTITKLAGSDPDITGDLTTEDFVRSIRDG